MLVWREARVVECKGQSDRRQIRDVARSQTIHHVVKNQSGFSQCAMESHHTTKEMCSFSMESHTILEQVLHPRIPKSHDLATPGAQ